MTSIDPTARVHPSAQLGPGVIVGAHAIVGPGCGVLFADWLNAFRIGGFPVGFWFAQQGSIAVFVVLILAYAVLLNRLDNKHRGELEEIRRSSASEDRA